MMRVSVLFPSLSVAFDDGVALLQVAAKPHIQDVNAQWPDTAKGCSGQTWNGPFENRKCKYQHKDRLWRIERNTLDECKALCEVEQDCRGFSYGPHGGVNVCMGCKDE